MDWRTTTLISDIRRHLDLTAPRTIAIACTERGQQRFRQAIEQLNNERIRFISIGDVPKEAAVIIVVSDGLDESREAYAGMNAAKQVGIPVVFGIPERRLSTRPPNWEGSGVHYEGMFWLAAQYAATIKPKGAYCEFGVYDGRTFTMAYHALNRVCTQFYAFDSFQGIGGTLDHERSHFKDGQYFASLETFRYNMQYSGVDIHRLKTYSGFLEESIGGKTPDNLQIGAISIVHIDVDVYAPALLALEFVAPQLNQGSLLMFDDYDQLAASNDAGERRALREWLRNHPEIEVEPYRAYGIFCRSFIVHRKKTEWNYG